MPFLLRVELPDVPGSLGRVATAIGEAGGDIEAIEIVEHRSDGMAVDDVLLETAPGVMPDSIVSTCNQLAGVQVLWVSRYAAGGNLFLDLEAVEALTADPRAAIDRLVELIPVTFRADWALRVEHTGSGLKIMHGSSAAPESLDEDVDWPPLARAARLEFPPGRERWSATLLAGAPLEGDQLVLIGRRGGPEILDSELARLQHLAALAVSIAHAG